MATVTKALMIPITKIDAPEAYRRRTKARWRRTHSGNRLSRAASKSPSSCPRRQKDEYVLIEGYRRLDIAKHLKMTEVPCVIDEIPDGVHPGGVPPSAAVHLR